MALITGDHFNHDDGAVMGIEIRKAHSKELTRLELYELVWSMPMTKVGKRLEISDVAVRKICIKYDIPRPPQGYWASERRRRQVRPVLPKALSENGETAERRQSSGYILYRK